MKIEQYLEKLKEIESKPGVTRGDIPSYENYLRMLDKVDAFPILIKLVERYRDALKEVVEADKNETIFRFGYHKAEDALKLTLEDLEE